MHTSGNFLSCLKGVKDPFEAQEGRWHFSPQWKRASSRFEGRISWFFSRCGRKLGVPLELQQEPQGPSRVASGKSSLHWSCEGPLGIALQSVPDPWSSSGSEAGTSVLAASIRNSTHGKGHDEGGFGIGKGGIEPQETPYSQASTLKATGCLLDCLWLSPTPLTLQRAVLHHLSRRRS